MTAVPAQADRAAAAAVDALARVLDPEAFEPSEHPRNVARELQKADRRRTAVAHAVRAVAAGYRPVSEDERSVEIRTLESALQAARENARLARSEGLDRETCRFWSGMCGWLRSRIKKLTEGDEPDWPDAHGSAHRSRRHRKG
jgi:hypothetical protein